jgi:phenylalanine-4-hydroxylase
MLSDPLFAEMVRAIGVASLGADEARLWHLTKVYWFVVEFGVVSTPPLCSSSPASPAVPRAFGAGILSSFGEMEHLLSGKGYSVAPFDPFAPQPKMNYKDGVQKRYMSLESFEAGRELLLEYCAATTPVGVRRRFGLL